MFADNSILVKFIIPSITLEGPSLEVPGFVWSILGRLEDIGKPEVRAG